MSPARCLSWAVRDVCKWCTPSCGHLQLGKWCLFDPIWSYLHANPSHSNLRTGAMLTHAHPPNSVVGSCDVALVRLYTPSKSQCQGSQDKGCLAESLLQWVFRRLHLCEETTELDWCMVVYANPSTHANARKRKRTHRHQNTCMCLHTLFYQLYHTIISILGSALASFSVEAKGYVLNKPNLHKLFPKPTLSWKIFETIS